MLIINLEYNNFQNRRLGNQANMNVSNIFNLFEKQNLEKNKKKWLGGIFAFALVAVIWSLTTQLHYENITNPSSFWQLTNNLISGKGYIICYEEYFPFCGPDNQITAMREPIPAFVLSIGMFIYPSIVSFAIVQGLLYLGTAFVIYQTLKKDIQIALLATLFWVTSVPVIEEISGNTGDLTSAFFFALSIFYFLNTIQEKKTVDFLVAGFFIGLATLSRTIFLGVALGWVLFLTIREIKTPFRDIFKSILNISVFFIALCFVIAPWVIRNSMVFGKPVIGTTLTGYNVFRHHYYLGNEPFIPHYVGSAEAYEAVKQLIQNSTLTGTENEAQMDDFYMQAGKEIILKHPVRYLTVVLYRVPMLWFNTGVAQTYVGNKVIKRDYITIVQELFFLFAIIVGCLKFYKPYMPLVLSFVLSCAAYLAIAAQLRYLVDIMPAIVILSALGISTFFPLLFKE